MKSVSWLCTGSNLWTVTASNASCCGQNGTWQTCIRKWCHKYNDFCHSVYKINESHCRVLQWNFYTLTKATRFVAAVGLTKVNDLYQKICSYELTWAVTAEGTLMRRLDRAIYLLKWAFQELQSQFLY